MSMQMQLHCCWFFAQFFWYIVLQCTGDVSTQRSVKRQKKGVMCRIDFSSSYLFFLNMMKMFDLQVPGPRCERFVYIVIFINLIVQISVGCLSLGRAPL